MMNNSYSKEKSVALFDLEGTLVSGHIVEGMMRYSISHRYRFLPLLRYFAYQTLTYPLNKGRLASDEKLANQFGTKLASVAVGGLRKDEAVEFFGWLIDEYVLERLRPDMLKVLRQHQNEGRIVVLLSAAFRELLEVIGQRLGIFYTVGTRLQVIDGKYTGRIIAPFCFGVNKVNLFHEFAESIRLKVDFNSSFAYSDSAFDIPILEKVGNPVAVYPDGKLLHLARQRGWQLIGK